MTPQHTHTSYCVHCRFIMLTEHTSRPHTTHTHIHVHTLAHIHNHTRTRTHTHTLCSHILIHMHTTLYTHCRCLPLWWTRKFKAAHMPHTIQSIFTLSINLFTLSPPSPQVSTMSCHVYTHTQLALYSLCCCFLYNFTCTHTP